MLASVKKSTLNLKNSIVKASIISKRWLRKHRKKIGLITTLILIAFKGVDITSQAVIINNTQKRIIDGRHINQVALIDNTNTVSGSSSSSQYWSSKINARSQQGTKLVVSARISCQVSSDDNFNLKQFLQDYGLNWRTYVIQKSRNIIIQNIASISFYQLNNSLILSKINSQYKSYQLVTNYPFKFLLISLKIQYPQNSFSINNTLGIQLLSQKSQYSQLLTNYQILNNKIINTTIDNNNITSISQRIGKIQAQIKIIQMEVQSLDNNWYTGLLNLQTVFGNNTIELRRYLWLYFQKVYNGTYNNYTLF